MHFLLVENSEAQAQKILHPLRQAGLDFTVERVATAGAFRAALLRGGWDLILCEHAMPGLAYPLVLAQVQELRLALPCIVLSPKGDEDLVARAMRLGARDVVSMGRLARLPQAVLRELQHTQRVEPASVHEETSDQGLLELMDEAYGLHEVIFDGNHRAVDFRFVALNPAFERLTGLRAATAVGRTALELRPGMDPAWIERFGRVALSGEPTAVDDYRSVLGRTFSGLVFCPRPDHFAVLFSDVTDQLALEASRERLAAAVDQTTEGLFTADLAGTILYANPALERILGLAPRLARGLAQAEVLPGLPPGNTGQGWQGRLQRQGGAQSLDCSISPVKDASGQTTSAVGVVRDVTLDAETERSLRQMEKMKALSEVARGVSHDFNNLLTAILSATELIEWQLKDDSPIRFKLQVIYQAVMRARELNRQILAFSRTGEDKFAPFDLTLVVKEAVHLIRSTFPATVAVAATLTSSLWANGDGSQLHQVIMNLAINALQAMLPGGGTLEIRLEELDGAARLTVQDTGCGMDPAIQERIFEPFFTTKERAAGKGLGLSVVHGIVHKHGGTIAVRSEKGAGSTFLVTLPCFTQDESPMVDEPVPEPTGTERILFVDDEEVLAALGKQGLQMLGYRVTSRSDGQEALEEFNHHVHDFDLLVTDLSMPNLSGVELTQAIHKVRPELPAILITGAFQDPLPMEGLATPFAEVLLKPVAILDMARTIRKVLDRRPAARKAESLAESAPPTVILLAEDSHTTRALLRTWLVKAGYLVDEARDGQEAWEALERNRGRYAMLITDIIMPRLDGLKLSSRVRGLDASIPILMLSSTEDTELVKEALHLHVNEFLSKPFESRLLVETVERLTKDQDTRIKVLRSHETAQAVRMAQRAMEAVPEHDLPIFSISEPLTDAGGDVFRAFRREDGSIFFTIADVAGHSVISSYAVAAFLGMLTNFLADSLDLRTLAHKLNRAIQAGPFSEVPICGLFGHWDPRTGRLHLLNAGVPHALWHHAARGSTTPIEINGTPLGVLDTPLVEEKVVLLAAGDRLLLGSDGFFDAAAPDRTSFNDFAGPIWENLGGTDLYQAINLISEAARAHSGGKFGDDLLVVALEQPPLEEDAPGFDLDLPYDPRAVDAACEALAAFLDASVPGSPSTPPGRFDTLLAVREALSNAMTHGNPGEGSTIHLAARQGEAGRCAITVLDEGIGFDLEAHQPPDTQHSERGRGIPLIRHFSSQVVMVGGELTMVFDGKTPELPR